MEQRGTKIGLLIFSTSKWEKQIELVVFHRPKLQKYLRYAQVKRKHINFPLQFKKKRWISRPPLKISYQTSIDRKLFQKTQLKFFETSWLHIGFLLLGLSGRWTVRQQKKSRSVLRDPYTKSFFGITHMTFGNQHASNFINYYNRDFRDFWVGTLLFSPRHDPSQTQTLNVWYIYLYIYHTNGQL